MTKRIILSAMALVLLATLVFGASIPLKATWTPNTDTVTAGYRIYRTDGTRTLIGDIPGKASSSYLFSITVPDSTTGTATFVIVAYSVNKTSAEAVASYPFDLAPAPDAVKGFKVESATP
jgi:hypothetical protein